MSGDEARKDPRRYRFNAQITEFERYAGTAGYSLARTTWDDWALWQGRYIDAATQAAWDTWLALKCVYNDDWKS